MISSLRTALRPASTAAAAVTSSFPPASSLLRSALAAVGWQNAAASSAKSCSFLPSSFMFSAVAANRSETVSNCSSTCAHAHSGCSCCSGVFTPTHTLLKPMRRRHLPVREPQAGDWTCSCGHSNSRFRRDCHKCNGPAPPLPLGESRPKLPGEDPHDWACACGKMNYRGNVNCHKCAMPKPPTLEQESKITQAMWKCGKCACLNRANKKFCFQCRALKTLVGAEVDKDGKEQKA